MFGKNEIVGQKYFRDADKLLVTSVFYTLQGEGPYAGMPAVFVRLAKCNLACDFCDTWFDSGDWYTVDELMDKVNMDNKAELLVITGGEPTLQNHMLYEFLHRASLLFKYTQIETNGILHPHIALSTTVVCSPKCVNGKYIKPHKELMKWGQFETHYKFVISANPDSPYHTIPDWEELKDWPSIYISPMNTYKRQSEKFEISSFWTPGLLDHEQNQKNHEYAAKYCMQHGYRLNLQMHLYTSLA